MLDGTMPEETKVIDEVKGGEKRFGPGHESVQSSVYE